MKVLNTNNRCHEFDVHVVEDGEWQYHDVIRVVVDRDTPTIDTYDIAKRKANHMYSEEYGKVGDGHLEIIRREYM